MRIILMRLTTAKIKIAKLCKGRRVCHTLLPLSLAVHTGSSMKVKMKSAMKSTVSVATI